MDHSRLSGPAGRCSAAADEAVRVRAVASFRPGRLAGRQGSGASRARTVASLLVAAALLGSGARVSTAQSQDPVIADFGHIRPMPEAGVQPDGTLVYRVLFDVTKAASDEDEVNPGLEHVARFVNLLGASGRGLEKAEIVAIVHGPATDVVLENTAYRAANRVDNPNQILIGRLRDSGVEIHVCGQALGERGFDRKAVLPEVQVDLAALTTLSTYQLRGFALIPE